MQKLEVGGGSGQAKGGRWEVPGRANRPCMEKRDGTQWPEADGSVRASLGLKMMSRSNNVNQFLKYCIFDFHDGSEGKESAFNAGDTGDSSSIPGSGRSPGRENGNPLQYSCLGNPTDRRSWQATVDGVAKSRT